MKKSLVLSFCALLIGITASAQFTSSNSSNAGTLGTAENWSKFYVSYNPLTIALDGKDMELKTGFSAGFSVADNLTADLPIFFEWGAAVNYAWDTENESEGSYKYSETISQLAVLVPVSVVYRWDMTSDIALAPYAGLRARYIAVFNTKYSYESDYGEESDTISIYDDEEDGGWGDDARRFFVGYQIGLQALYKNKISIGLEYEGYFAQLHKDDDFDSDLKTWSISLGFLF